MAIDDDFVLSSSIKQVRIYFQLSDFFSFSFLSSLCIINRRNLDETASQMNFSYTTNEQAVKQTNKQTNKMRVIKQTSTVFSFFLDVQSNVQNVTGPIKHTQICIDFQQIDKESKCEQKISLKMRRTTQILIENKIIAAFSFGYIDIKSELPKFFSDLMFLLLISIFHHKIF